MSLNQKSIAEIEKRPEVYVPTDSDKSRGKFALVYEKLDEDGDPDISSMPHIIPTFGTHHEITVLCWCSPKLETHKDTVMCIHTGSQ